MKPRQLSSVLLLAAALVPAGAARAQDVGVILYEGPRLTGERAAFDRDVPDLQRTPFGSRRTSSVDVARGCRVLLFELPGYRGESLELRERDNDLGNTRLGRRSVSSLRVECRSEGGWGSGGWGPQGREHDFRDMDRRERGVTLYRDADREGPSETFDEDVPDLSGTRIGARSASSIEVPPGCVATLFSRPGYRGRSTTFRETDNNLRNTEVGNDTAASLRVDCGERPRRPRGPRLGGGPGSAEGVTLYADKDFEGPSETFRTDVPDLGPSRIGARSASSIRVPPGCRVTLFSEPGYRGRSTTLDQEHSNLRNTPVGNDAVQSMRIECGSSRW